MKNSVKENINKKNNEKVVKTKNIVKDKKVIKKTKANTPKVIIFSD
jgi:hypothetical protein